CSQLDLTPIPNPASTSRTSAPMIRDSRMLPTRSPTASGQSTQLSWTSTARRPSRPPTAATCLVGLDSTPPIDTSVSAPSASASGTRYSSLRTLLPPNASPELQSSRLAQICAPPRCAVSRSSGCTGLGPNISGYRGKSLSDTQTSSCRGYLRVLRSQRPGGGAPAEGERAHVQPDRA